MLSAPSLRFGAPHAPLFFIQAAVGSFINKESWSVFDFLVTAAFVWLRADSSKISRGAMELFTKPFRINC
jgi:hypothetical protein